MAENGIFNSPASQEIIVFHSKLKDKEHVEAAACGDDVTSAQDFQNLPSNSRKFKKMKVTHEDLQTGEQPDEGKNMRSITTLNNDCLLHIFGFLEWRHLINVKRVCKRWQELANKISLKHLSMNGNDLRDAISPKFLMAIKNLKTLKLEYCYELKDEQLKPLIDTARSLEKFELSYADELEGYSLINLNENIKQLNIGSCSLFDGKEISKVLRRSAKLENLTVSFIRGCRLKMDCLMLCSHSIKEIRFQEVIICHEDNVPSLPNLRILEVSENCWMSNKLLAKLVRACPNIEELNVSGYVPPKDYNNDLTDTGIRSLVTLTKLKCLRVSRHHKITSSSIKFLAMNLKCRELKEIDLRGCKSLTNLGPISLITHFPNLETLDLGFIPKIKKDLIKSALCLVKLRQNNVPLTLHLTGVPDEEFKDGDRILLEVHEVKPFGSFEF